MSLPFFFGNCFGSVSSSAIRSPIVGRNASLSTPNLATSFATSRWSLTRHGRSSGSRVSLGRSFRGLVDGVEEGVCVDELFVGSVGTASELSIVHARAARENEELGDGDVERVGDSLDDVESDIISNSSLDAGYRWAGDAGASREPFL